MLFTSPTPDMTGNIKVLWQEAFGDTNEFIDSYMESAYSAKACRCAIEDNRIVAALHLMDCSVKVEKFAYVYAAATSKAYRGRGIFRSLMRDTEEYLISEGYAGMILVPGDAGLAEMYEKLGFCPFEGLTGTTVLASGAEKTVLRRVNAAEYAIPQRRERVIIVGGSNEFVSDFQPTPRTLVKNTDQVRLLALPAVIGVEDALGDLPELTHSEDGSHKPYKCEPQNAFQQFMRGFITAEEYLNSYK